MVTMLAAQGLDGLALALLPQHRAQLDESAIAPGVAAARGYASATARASLRALGFADFQCRVPGLLVPTWRVTGEPGTPQFRPDRPRNRRDGKPVKYEMPAGARLHLDVPPGVQPRLGDPSHPLAITEGAKKADSAVSHGLDCLALAGVFGWRGKNTAGGLVALPDWELVALNGRRVYLAFDSDAAQNQGVYTALARLRAFLQFRHADVRIIHWPEAPYG